MRVVKHLLGLPNVSVEEWSRIADALHLLASSHCVEFMSVDDRRFARRSKGLNVKPVVVPENKKASVGRTAS